MEGESLVFCSLSETYADNLGVLAVGGGVVGVVGVVE